MSEYFSREELESFTGFASTDFRNAGAVMTATGWATFCTFLSQAVSESINHFCNVTGFEPHEVIEYKNGKGARADDDQYLDDDYYYYLLETATGVTEVAEDTSTKTATPVWVARAVRSTATAGDYEFYSERELGTIRFHSNMPLAGNRNVRVTYYGGYETTNPAMNEIKMIALRIAQNILLTKKKAQEASTLRNTGVRDYSTMFDITGIVATSITADIQADLSLHRRWRMGGDTWD